MLKQLKITQISLILSVCCLTACSSDEPNSDNPDKKETRKEITLSRAEKEIAAQNSSFGIELLKAEASLSDKKAFVISPYSVSCAYSILANGVVGPAQSEIINTLFSDQTSIADVNAFHARMLKELPTLDSKVTVLSSNALCTNPDTNFNNTFIGIAANHYQCEYFLADLSTPEGIGTVNSWAEKKTQGIIKNFLQESLNSKFGILNANYFKGAFNKKFSESKTTDEDFTPDNGSTHKVKTMCEKQTVGYFESDDMTVVQLKFGTGAFRLNLILPGNLNLHNPDSQGIPTVKTIQQLLSSLTPLLWGNAKKGLYPETAILHLPKFTVEHKSEIRNALEKIGITTVFNTPNYNTGILESDFGTLINETPTSTWLKLDENGAEAASVTMIAGTDIAPAPPMTIRVNRPFLFMIDEASTGLILFAGMVKDI